MVRFQSSLSFHFRVFPNFFGMSSEVVSESNEFFPIATFRVCQMNMISSTFFLWVGQVDDKVESVGSAIGGPEFIPQALQLRRIFAFFRKTRGIRSA